MKLTAALRRRWSMPLLAKELVEQANRRRTYIIRTLYGAMLFCGVGLFIYQVFHRYSSDPLDVLGSGRELFQILVGFQFVGIFLFLPAVMVGALTLEKERDSLALLLITGLSPWQIILQKYLGRLVPMLTFLLLSLPLMAVSYALGGITSDQVLSAVVLLLLCCLQVGAFCLMLSSFCGTTSAAFVLSYILGACFYFGPLCAAALLYELLPAYRSMSGIDEMAWMAHCPPVVMADMAFGSGGWLRGVIPIVGSILVFLVLARVFLWRRAFVQPRSLLLKTFRWLDRFYHRANIGGVVLMRSAPELPGDRPVAWWEVTRRALGQPQYLFRILAAVMTPTLLAIALMLTAGRGYRQGVEVLSAMLFLVWPLAALLLAVQGASTFTLDRTRQRLDPLLVAPIRTGDLVRQKTAALRRLILVWCVPIFTIVGMEAWWKYRIEHGAYAGYDSVDHVLIYLMCSFLSAVIYLPLIAWLALWISMKVHSQSKATIIAIATIVAWCAAAPIVAALLDEMLGFRGDAYWILLLSPASIVPMNELTVLDELRLRPLPAVLLNFTAYGVVLWWIRHLCLTRADRYLGRA